MLNREEIMQKDDLPKEEVEVSEWGGTVIVRGMNAKERDIIEGTFLEVQNGKGTLMGIRAKLVVMTTVDDNGERLFNKNDEDALSEKSGSALDKLFLVALSLSGIGDKDLETAEKNLEVVPEGSSSLD